MTTERCPPPLSGLFCLLIATAFLSGVGMYYWFMSESCPLVNETQVYLDSKNGPGVSTNRKISPLVRHRNLSDPGQPEDRYDIDLVKAAFGLASGPECSCPGATNYCANDCYSMSIEGNMIVVGEKMRRNLAVLQLASPEAQARYVDDILKGYIQRCEKRNVPESRRIFRWHWAGDVFSHNYAAAIAEGFRNNPGVKGAIYTRTYQEDFNVVPILKGIDNLNLYLSVDQDNWRRALEVYSEDPKSIRLAFLGEDYAHANQTVGLMVAAGAPNLDVGDLLVDTIDEDGYLPFHYSDILRCPEEYPYSRNYLDLSNPFPPDMKAETVAAKKEGREIDMGNVRLLGACAACMACYKPNKDGQRIHKHVIFVKKKVMDGVGRRPDPNQLAAGDIAAVPVEIKPKPPKNRRRPRRRPLEPAPQLF